MVLGLAVAGEAADGGPTYHRDVVRILQRRCQDCHRPGQVAPFPLLSYEQARKRAADLAQVAADRQMPPWHPSTTEGGPFKDARVLSEAEIRTLGAWAEAGAPEGDPAEAPAERVFSSDWPLGPPDLVLKPSEVYTLAATGPDQFRVFVIPTGLTEDKFVSAVDFRPGNARVVHHVVAAWDVTGQARKLDAADPEPGYESVGGFGFTPGGGMAGWAPGKSARHLPEGVGRYLPAGSDLLIQLHYNRTGKVETDATEVGLYFARKPVAKQLRVGFVMPPLGLNLRPRLRIPPGAGNHEVRGSWQLARDYTAIGVLPHMHWRGKDMLVTATLPDRSKRTLIRIDRWDFNWQDAYEFTEPVELPKGTRIDMVVHFDNSAANPANPDPTASVSWGEQTQNEMAFAFFQLVRPEEQLDGRMPERTALPANFDSPEEEERLTRYRKLQEEEHREATGRAATAPRP